MKVWVYVEGPSDVSALDALWSPWKAQLKSGGIGFSIHNLKNKSQFLRKIGHRAAQKLVAEPQDLVVGFPDLYPAGNIFGDPFNHTDMATLRDVQQRHVREALKATFGIRQDKIEAYLSRFYAGALKHDLEMLLLVAQDQLRSVLDTNESLGNWIRPVEDQNNEKPPKRIVEELFRTRSRRKKAYRDTIHAPQVMKKASTHIDQLLSLESGQLQCPEFKKVLDWIGHKTGIAAYESV